MTPDVEAAQHPWPALGVLLLRDGLVTKDELNAILDGQSDARQQRITGTRLGEILIEREVVSPVQVARLLAEQYELPFMELTPSEVDSGVARALPLGEAQRFAALPINRRADGSYDVAIADPSTVVFSDELRGLLGSLPHFVVVGREAVMETIDRAYTSADVGTAEAADTSNVVELHEVEESTSPFQRPGTLAQLWPPLGALLVRDGILSDEQLESALAQQRLSTSHRLGEILVGRGVVSSATIARLVAEQYELPFSDLDEIVVDPSVARLLPRDLAETYGAVPVGRTEDGAVQVAIADPTSVFHSDDLHTELDAPLSFIVAPPEEIAAFIESLYDDADPDHADDQTAEVDADLDHADEPTAEVVEHAVDLEPSIETAAVPVADVTDSSTDRELQIVSEVGEVDLRRAVREALDGGAAVVHLSHHDVVVDLRARTGATLRSLGAFSAAALPALIGELADDPSLELQAQPTARGTKVTATVVDRPFAPTALNELGLTQLAEQALRESLERPGLVIVTGPAGSGVTTTLHAALDVLAESERAVASVEDEMVRTFDGADQTALGDPGVASYAEGILRHWEMDADVIFVSDLPDDEAVRAALRCGLADRWLLAGMTETDAAGAAARVRAATAGADRLGAAVRCIVSQRLVQLVCDQCRETYYASPPELGRLGFDADGAHRLLARGRGCRACNGTGYRGRTAVFEVVPATGHALTPSGTTEALSTPAVATMRDELVRLCLEGLTTTDELDRLSQTST
jgi:type IV pilus assembly protein PilB